MGNINIELPEDVHKRLKAYCVLHDLTIQAFVTKALERRLKKEVKA